MVSSVSSPPVQKVIIQNITPALIDNMFIVNPPKEVRQAIEETLQDEQNDDMGALDFDFLEYDGLDGTIEDYIEESETTRLDYDFLESDMLVDLLDVVEELIRTMGDLEDVQANAGSGDIILKGAVWGRNEDSQYTIYREDGGIVFYRNVNGVISLKFANGGSIRVETDVDGYGGIITADGGDDIGVFIKQD